MNETIVSEKYCQKNFLDLINDAIILVELVEHWDLRNEDCGETREYGGWPDISLSRAAIISSAFCLEAAANCCIASLDVGMRLKDAVERKNVFRKFEIFLEEIDPNKTLNQNKVIVDRAKEVIQIRDSFAHPKVLPLSLSTNSCIGRKDVFPHHNLNKDFMCTFEHAVSALKSTVDFLDYFFRDRCGFDEQKVCDVLIQDTKHTKGSAEIPCGHVFQIPEFIRAKEKWGLPLEFFGGP